MLIINQWTGRLGNNILQILRAIHFAKLKNHRLITFTNHDFLSENKIIIDNNKDNNETISDSFFYINNFGLTDPEPVVLKKYFQIYISHIFKLTSHYRENINNRDHLYIHFRGGDIFSNKPHSGYVQPPLSYYKNIIKDYKIVNIVCEDDKNPCVNKLIKYNNVNYISGSLTNDLEILSKAENLVIGFGTFGFLLYLMNTKLKNLYIPDYFIHYLPKGSWGNDINIHIIDLPNYIKVGEWKNTQEQRQTMLNY